MMRLDLPPNAQFSLSTQAEGRTQASMGRYQITGPTLRLNPGTEGAQRFQFTVPRPDTLRLTRPDGNVLILARTNTAAFGTAPGSVRPPPDVRDQAFPPPPAVSPPTQPGLALPGQVPTPDWLARALANPPRFSPSSNSASAEPVPATPTAPPPPRT